MITLAVLCFVQYNLKVMELGGTVLAATDYETATHIVVEVKVLLVFLLLV
jgi:hypothetical protein